MVFRYAIKFVSLKIFNMLILHFHIFQGCFEVLNLQYFKLLCMSVLLSILLQHVPLLVVQLVINYNKDVLIKQNKNH